MKGKKRTRKWETPRAIPGVIMDPTVLTALRQLQNDLRGSLTLYNDRCPPPEDGYCCALCWVWRLSPGVCRTPPIVPEIQKLCTISRKEITTSKHQLPSRSLLRCSLQCNSASLERR